MTKDFNFDINFINNQKNDSVEFFKQKPNARRIPEANYESPTLGFAAQHIDTQIDAPNRAGANSIVDDAHIKNEMDLRAAIRTSLQTDDGKDLGNKVEAAQIALQEGMPAPSVGSIFKKQNYPLADKSIAKVVNIKLTSDDALANIKTNLGLDPESGNLSDIFDERTTDFSTTIAELVTGFTPESVKELRDFLPEDSTTRDIIDMFSDPEKFKEAGMFPGAALQEKLFSRLGESVGLKKNASFRDVLEFLSFMPTDKNAEIDIENAVKIVFSQDTLDGRMKRLSQWDTEFRQKYGEKGYYQLSAFMVKEGLIDAASIGLALKNPKLAKNLIADSRDKLLTRMTKALGRASIYGVGGTGVQASMDAYLGFDTNIPQEFALRTAGGFVGEGVAAAIAKAGRGILGRGNKMINQGEHLVGAGGARASAVEPDAVVHALSDVQPRQVNNRLLLQTAKEFNLKDKDLATEPLGSAITRATVETGNTTPYRNLASKALEGFRTQRVGNLGHIFDLTESEIKAQAFGAKTLKNEIMLNGVGNRLIGETITKQTEVDNVLNYYFDQGLRKVARRQGTLKGDDSVVKWKSLFSEPRNWVGRLDDDLFDELLNKDVYQKALTDAQEVAFKGLDKKATGKVLSIRAEIEEIAAKNSDFRLTQSYLDSKGLSAAEQDAFWATGKLLDFSAILAENTMVSSALKKGLKQIPDGRIVKVVEQRADGITLVKELGVNKKPIEIATAEVQDVKRVMGYKKYFVPRRADNPDYLLGVLNPTTGKLEVKFASRYKSEIDDKMVELDGTALDTGEIAFYWRNMTDEKSLNFGLSNNSMSIIDSLDEPAIQKIRDALTKSGQEEFKDVDIENLRLAFDNITYGSIASQQVAGKRSKTGLMNVAGEAFDYKPADEAITQHLMETAALQFQDFRSDAIKQFQKEFAEVLDGTKNWDQDIPNILGKSDLVQRAKSVQGFIRNNVFNETGYGKEVRLSIDAWADRMRKAGGRRKKMIESLEKMPIVENAFKQTRDGTAMFRAASSSLVFAGNIGSFVTQVAPSAAMIAGIKGLTNPTHLAQGWGDMLGAFAIRAGLPDAFASKEAKQALRAIEQSGILSKADISDIANAAYGQSSTIFNKAMFFVSKGEMANRANIWFTVRAEMMDKAAKGELLSLNGNRVLSKADIDTTEFSQIVSEKAKQIFLDTTQAGRLRALSGVGSVLGQFTAPVIKTHTMWFAQGLSKTERVGASMGLFAFYGVNAVPFVAAGLALTDKTIEVVSGGGSIDDYTLASDMANNIGNALLDEVGNLAGFSEEDKEFFRTAVKKGGVAALTGGEVDLYHKMSIGLFINESLASVEDPLEAIPLVSILSKAAEGSGNLFQMLSDLYESQINPESENERVRDLRTFTGDALNEVGNILPGFGKIVDTLNNHPDTKKYLNPELEGRDDKGWVTRSGKRVESDKQFDATDRMLNLFGITPAPVQANRELMKKQFDRVAILKQMKESWREKYKSAGTASARVKVMKEAIAEVGEAERVLAATYNGALAIAAGSSDNKTYRMGSLRKQWMRMFQNIEIERIAGNKTTSLGENNTNE